MTDIIVGLIVVVIVCAALLYIRKEKKKGNACIGCSCASTCGKSKCDCHTEQKS